MYDTAVGAKGIMCQRVKDFDAWDSQAACLRFDSGLVASIYTSNLAQHAPSNGLAVFTPEQVLTITEAPWSSKLTVVKAGQTIEYNGADRGWREPRWIEDDTFVEAVQSGDTSKIRAPYSQAVKTLAVHMAINQATESGKTVRVADVD